MHPENIPQIICDALFPFKTKNVHAKLRIIKEEKLIGIQYNGVGEKPVDIKLINAIARYKLYSNIKSIKYPNNLSSTFFILIGIFIL